MWIGEHRGSKVVVKVLKVFSSSNLDEVTRVSNATGPSNNLFKGADCRIEVLQRSIAVEEPLPSKRAPIIRSDNEQRELCNGIEVDGQREHQRVPQEA